MTAILDSIRRVVAEDAAHGGTTHEVYLRVETMHNLMGDSFIVRDQRGRPPSILGLPLRILPRASDRRDCIATIRGGQVISVTNL